MNYPPRPPADPTPSAIVPGRPSVPGYSPTAEPWGRVAASSTGVVLPPIRLIGGWALAVVAVVTMVVAARIIEWVLAARNYRLRVDYESGALGAAEYMSRLESAQPWFWVSTVAMLAQLVATVLFIVWLYLARSNAELLSAARHRLSRGWALACFLPVVNWFLPPVVLDDIQRAAHPAAPRDARPLPANSTSLLIVFWWVSFVLGSILAFVSYLFGFASRTGGASGSRAGVGVLVGLVGIALLITAAALLAVLLLRVTRWQENQAAQFLPDPHLPRPPRVPESELAFAAPHLFSSADAVRPGSFLSEATGPTSLSPAGRGLSELTAALLFAVAAGPAIVALAAPLYPQDLDEDTIEYDLAMDEWVPVMLLGLGIWAVALMLAGGVFIYWLSRARANAEILAPAGHRLARSWVIGGWFVPLANLVLPALVVTDIHSAGRPEARSAAWLVASWWCAWIGAWVAAWIGLNFLASWVLWLAAFLFAVGAGLLTAIIRQTDSDQIQAAARS